MLKYKKLYNLILKEKPLKSDAIIWLQGDRYDRGYKVIELYKKGYSKKIIISGNNILIGNKKRIGENNISLDKMKNFLLKRGVCGKSIIVDDGAMDTKEQARNIFEIVTNKKWSRLILVGSSYYQPRAFLTFLKQIKKIKWKGTIINQPVIIDFSKKPSGRDKNVNLLFKEEFIKIKKYKKDLVSVLNGLKYFEN